MILDCCDGHLCKICLENVRNNTRNCPLCREPNFTAKFSRLMVTLLSQLKLFCPAEECNESVPYANFARHKETCRVLNRKPCSQCNGIYSRNDFQEHFSCFEELNEKTEADRKKIEKLESDVEEGRMTIAQLITTNESERREFRDEMRTKDERIKLLEEKLKQEEEEVRNGNQGRKRTRMQVRNEDLEKIKNELGIDGGAGHKFGEDRRQAFNEEMVRRVLRGLEAGLTKVNFKFHYTQNLEVREGGWYLRQQTSDSNYGDGFWKLTLQKNGRRVDFRADADEIHGYSGDVIKSEKNLRPDSNGMVKFKGNLSHVRWNITIQN